RQFQSSVEAKVEGAGFVKKSWMRWRTALLRGLSAAEQRSGAYATELSVASRRYGRAEARPSSAIKVLRAAIRAAAIGGTAHRQITQTSSGRSSSERIRSVGGQG